MEALHEYGQYAEDATTLINASVDQGGSGEDIVARIDAGKQELAASERVKAEWFVSAVRDETRGAVVTTLDPGVGGMWDGSNVHIATDILYVDQSIERTIDQLEETSAHEAYHAEHDHTAPLYVMAETKEDIALIMGNQQFTETGLIEGLTVLRTGDRFVSAEYVAHKNKLVAGMHAAGLDVTDVERAVNEEKDVTLIDDRRKSEDTIEFSAALAP